MLAEGKMAIHLLARWAALLAMLLFQPQAALHFATSEEHTAALVEMAAHTGHAHNAPGHSQDGHSHPDHTDHRTCDICVLVSSVALPLVAPKLGHGLARHAPPTALAAHPVRAEKRLRIGDPVRAPPRAV